MKFRSIRHLIGEGFSNIWVNRLMSLASIGVLVACMVIIGLAILITKNVDVAMGKLEEQNVVMVYMEDYNWALYSDADSEDKETTDKDETSEDGAASDEETDEDSEKTSQTDEKEDSKKEDSEKEDSEDSAEENENVNEEEEEEADENGIRPSDYTIHNEKEAKDLCKEIEKIKNVEKVEFVSREDGLKSVTEALPEGGKDAMSFDDKYGNPIPYAAKVTMKSMAQFDETVKSIEALDGVDEVISQRELASQITAFKEGIGVAGFWIIAILLIIALVIVSNTIRVTMYNRKLEISIMKAVGATDAFVRIPFVVEGMVIGIISAIISEFLLYFCYRVATETIAGALGAGELIKYGDVAGEMFVVFAIIGIVAGAIGSFIMIGKYLRREGSEFAAI